MVSLILVGVHVLGLFSSPAFLGSDYSRKMLIDSYCNNNANGSSLILNSTVSYSEKSLKQINAHKEENSVEYNTVLGIGANNAEIEGLNCCLVGSPSSKLSSTYNAFRVYSDENWDLINRGNYIFISDFMAASFVPYGEDPKNYKDFVKDKDVAIKISDQIYMFKVGGFYNTTIKEEGWRSRGNYFNETLNNCVFISEEFLSNKFNNVFQMFTSDTVESGQAFRKFELLVETIGSHISNPKNKIESDVLNKINALNKRTNVVMRTVTIVISLILILGFLLLSTFLFDTNHFWLNFKLMTIIWCLLYVLISYVFVFATKGTTITFFGFNAFGANKASLTITSIYTFLLVISVLIKSYLYYKKLNKNLIIHYNV